MRKRWLLIGPKGSGTDVHQDPAGTVAWNFLISGQKLWVFIHPSLTSKQVYQGCNADDQPSLTWFTKYVHLIAKEHPPLHLVQVATAAAPTSVLYVPLLHSRHVDSLDAPTSVLYDPATQSSHFIFPVSFW